MTSLVFFLTSRYKFRKMLFHLLRCEMLNFKFTAGLNEQRLCKLNHILFKMCSFYFLCMYIIENNPI
jgi:hypothetical protein